MLKPQKKTAQASLREDLPEGGDGDLRDKINGLGILVEQTGSNLGARKESRVLFIKRLMAARGKKDFYISKGDREKKKGYATKKELKYASAGQRGKVIHGRKCR